MRLVRTDIRVEELEAALIHVGTPGSVVEDDDLDTARTEIHDALRAVEDGDGSYQDRLEDAVGCARRGHESILAFGERVRVLHAAGHLRIGNSSAAAVVASVGAVIGALEEWLEWADRELIDLD